MPELPEVETIRRGLAPLVEGRTITRIDVADERWSAPLSAGAVADAVQGRRVEALRRRGKYLVFALEDEVFLVVHLRMTGNLLYDTDPEQPYRRVTLTLSDGHQVGDCEEDGVSNHELAFCDARRFGTGELLLGEPALDAFFAARLGVEPLEGVLSGAVLHAAARGRRTAIKSFLLDQRHVAGVGNIYADEALYRAFVHPLREAGRLTRAQWDAVAEGVVAALSAGLAAGGATIDDFRHPDGVYGNFQHEFLVHRRKGEPCGRCGTTIVKFVVGGRGTYACERCQPKPRAARRTLIG